MSTLLFCLFFSAGVYAQQVQSSKVECPFGNVQLRIEFLSSGEVGKVSVVKGLPNGLTDRAIEAARTIKFEPKIVNGVAQSTTRQVEYTFTIDDFPPGDLLSQVVILRSPAPKFPRSAFDPQTVQVVEVPVILHTDGKVKVEKIEGEWPADVKNAAISAASRIKFKPAIHRCGKPVPQSMIMRYEIK